MVFDNRIRQVAFACLSGPESGRPGREARRAAKSTLSGALRLRPVPLTATRLESPAKGVQQAAPRPRRTGSAPPANPLGVREAMQGAVLCEAPLTADGRKAPVRAQPPAQVGTE